VIQFWDGLSDPLVILGAHAVKKTCRIHHGNGPFAVNHVGTGQQAGNLEDADERQVGSQAGLAVAIYAQSQQRPQHQIDQGDDADALPSAVCSEEEIGIPMKHNEIAEQQKNQQADSQVYGKSSESIHGWSVNKAHG
jgi:hypothetical protein